VVVPRSLVFNWVEEAHRFAPKLRVLNYTGIERGQSGKRLEEFDLVITTYGILRRDITELRKSEFDYVILDEAQAVKNSASQSAKACRLLRSRRRLAVSGTPVENHLGELWALFEFLNPGMLGRNPNRSQLFNAGRNGRRIEGDIELAAETSQNMVALGRALRPFLLRRTKFSRNCRTKLSRRCTVN
jgi:SNF2 family DNA or RNA helicase